MQCHAAPWFARAAYVAVCAIPALASAASFNVTPFFPAYGQSITVELKDAGPAPFMPATRYSRTGNGITIDLEHAAGGYFGGRLDIGYAPLSIGELPPGNYSIRARLFDIANPDAAPRVFTQELSVAAPEAPGVYPVPSAPGAHQPVELVVRADAPVDASSLKATVSGSTIRVDFEFATDAPLAAPYAAVKVAGLGPGSYHVEAFGRDRRIANGQRRFAGNFQVRSTATVVEYYNDRLDHYFMSAGGEEIAGLDADPALGFRRTGHEFKAWLRASDAPGYAVPVCRFYASGYNSHFYTSHGGECEFLKVLEQKQRAEALAKGQAFKGWQFEGLAFYVLAPQDGQCPAGSRPIYRAYNDRAPQQDANHRFSVTTQMRLAMMMTWVDEGVAFCSPL